MGHHDTIRPPLADWRFCASGDDLLDRTYRPEIPGYFSAHPDIAPYVDGPIDFTDAMRETAVFLFGEHGGLIFEWCAPGVYEAHIMLTREGRGAWGIAATKEALLKLGAEHVWARIMPGNRPLMMHASLCGFRKVELRTLHDGDEPVAYQIYEWRK